MTAYLVWRGMRLEAIGVWRGLSSAVGLAGTFVYHISSQNLSLESTGMWSIIFQFTCLSLSYISLVVDDYDTSMTMLIAGVCSSRVGLWVFDISVTQVSPMPFLQSWEGRNLYLTLRVCNLFVVLNAAYAGLCSRWGSWTRWGCSTINECILLSLVICYWYFPTGPERFPYICCGRLCWCCACCTLLLFWSFQKAW